MEPLKDWKINLEGNYNTAINTKHWEALPVGAFDTDGEPYLFSWDGIAVGSTAVSILCSKREY